MLVSKLINRKGAWVIMQPDTNKKVNLEEILEKIELEIKDRLPDAGSYPAEVIEAMNYSMASGGKRIRPLLMYLAYHAFKEVDIKPKDDDSLKVLFTFMTALEMIHTHSLIHDDLPALDNDSLRRGRPTVHVQYSESTAILAGDALLNYAYEITSRVIDEVLVGKETDSNKRTDSDKEEESDKKSEQDMEIALENVKYMKLILRICKAQQILSSKTGIDGMLGGQSLDVQLSGKRISNKDRDYIYINKTCALIEAPLMIGAVLAGGSDTDIEKMQQAGRAIGMAFQIQDDILDVVGDSEKLGKEVSQDARNEKNTFVAEFGIDYSKKYVKEQSEAAVEIIKEVMAESEYRNMLTGLIEKLADRDH